MSTKNIGDFQARSRTNVVPRVAKRINDEERRTRDRYPSEKKAAVPTDGKKLKKPRPSMMHTEEKVMSYAEIKKWNQKFKLDGKSVY